LTGLPQISRRSAALVATAAVLLLAVLSAAFFISPAREINGQVVDAVTGQPLPEAVVNAAGQSHSVASDGSFNLPALRFGSSLAVEARGYLPANSIVGLSDRLQITLQPRVLEGEVTDASTGKAVSGVSVSAGPLSVLTDEQGRFRLVAIEQGTEVIAQAEGFVTQRFRYEEQPIKDLALQPNTLTIIVANQYTGEPVEGAEATDGRSKGTSDQQGTLQLKYLAEGATVSLQKEGFAPVEIVFSESGTVEAKLRPDTVVGVVKDPEGRPIAGASVSDGDSTTSTDEQGSFKLTGVEENAKLSVSANGFERRQLEVGQQAEVEVELRPFAAKGLYLTFYGVGDEGLRNHVLELADQTEINAVVIDIKGDRGWIAYPSSVPMVKEIGAQQEIMIDDPKQFLAELRDRGVYTIARIVAFKDNPLATARPDLAVINANTGRPWVDNEGLAWTNAMLEEVWDYNIALAVEAIQLGFDEVQFDYVRFPSDASAGNSLESIDLGQENLEANRVAAISGFLAKASEAIHAAGGLVSVDIFGYVVWRYDDLGIGQRLEEVAEHVDYVSPMVYPNLFWHGLPMEDGAKYGNQEAGLYPYEIVYESMKVAVQRIGAAKLRPWLEYYDDYITGKQYTAADMEAQKLATYDNGITGWLFWDPTNQFNKGGFDPER
jgi:hypothetical protein